MITVDPVPCAHIEAYYAAKWESHKCLAYNLLRRGYWQWANGLIEPFNNLYGE